SRRAGRAPARSPRRRRCPRRSPPPADPAAGRWPAASRPRPRALAPDQIDTPEPPRHPRAGLARSARTQEHHLGRSTRLSANTARAGQTVGRRCHMSITVPPTVRRWLVPATAALAVIGGGVAIGLVTNVADPALEPRSAEELLVDLQTAQVDG